MVTSLSHPKIICYKQFHKAYGLTKTTTTSNTGAGLDTIVWFTPTVPSLRARHLLASHHLDTGSWIKTVTKGVRGFMAALRKKEEDVARRHQEKRSKLEKILSYTEAENLRSDTNWPSGRVEGILYVHETDRDLMSSTRHVDASRGALLTICYFCSLYCTRRLFYFVVFFPQYQQSEGRGARSETLSFCSVYLV